MSEQIRAILQAAATLEESARVAHRSALDRRRRAIRLARERGLTLDAIAGELGVSRKAVIDQLRRTD